MCVRKKYQEPNGHLHDFCGLTCRNNYLKFQQQNLIPGILHYTIRICACIDMYSTNIIVLTFICVLTCTVEPCFAIPATLRTNKSGWICEVAGLVRWLDLRVSLQCRRWANLCLSVFLAAIVWWPQLIQKLSGIFLLFCVCFEICYACNWLYTIHLN